MEKLKESRGICRGKVTRLFNYASTCVDTPENQPKDLSIDILTAKTERLKECWTELNLIQSEIENSCTSEDLLAEHESYMASCEELYDKTVALFKRAQRNIMPKTSPSATPLSQVGVKSSDAHVQLPKIDLPKFRGNYIEWVQFHDLFHALIHQNSSLTPAQKLQYLKLCLEGDASTLIENLSISDANYPIAFELIKNRFDNKRRIRQAHFKALFDQRVLKSESAQALRTLHDVTLRNVMALTVIDENVQYWDSVLVYLISEKLDPESRTRWESESINEKNPKFSDLLKFINNRAQVLEISSGSCSDRERTKSKTSIFSHLMTSNNPCPLCKDSHKLYKCAKFLQMNVKTREEFVRTNKLCFNCLQRHLVSECSSSNTCRICKGKHHSLIHRGVNSSMTTEGQRSASVPPAADGWVGSSSEFSTTPSSAPVLSGHVSDSSNQQALLSTILLNVTGDDGNQMTCRALLDNGSMVSFISESLVQLLRLPKTSANLQINGIGECSRSVRGMVSCTIEAASQPQQSIQINAYVLPSITGNLPTTRIPQHEWSHLQGIQLADPHFNEPYRVDMLLGADIMGEILTPGIIKGPRGTPTAFNTMFGWVLTGSVSSASDAPHLHPPEVSCHLILTDDDNLTRFWKMEELPSKPAWSLEEKECETHFISTHTRSNTGRYYVSLPFKDSPLLGASKDNALRRLKSVEKRLARNQQHRQSYHQCLDEYLTLGHAESVPEPDMKKSVEETFYLPHHFVLNEASSTTKLRVVFDASCKSSTGVSLNDKIMIGPKLQSDLYDILIRFRIHPVAMIADIGKMYRQIYLHPEDKDYHRFLWRNDPGDPVQEFRLTTVTFGVASSSHHARRCLHQLAQDEQVKYPQAADVIRDDSYMDDVLCGASTVPQALTLQKQLIDMLASSGFVLRKWVSNSAELLQHLPPEMIESKVSLDLDLDESFIKTLGVSWNHIKDTFQYEVNPSTLPDVTKRTLLSDTAKVFDPMGLISPTLVVAKILFQRLWLAGIEWDDPLPPDIQHAWLQWRTQICQLQQLRIPRCITTSRVHDPCYQLCGFSDASERAYAAVVYLRAVGSNGSTMVNLVTGKTKVAPLKPLSLPRLELSAAWLLARLLKRVGDVLSSLNPEVLAWTDSLITLQWIRGHPSRWKTFVANRVSEIQDLCPPAHWRYVPSKENPADCASRGLNADELCNFKLWWNGPSWLQQGTSSPPQPRMDHNAQKTVDEEQRKNVCMISRPATDTLSELFPFSSLTKIKRVAALVFRFIN